MRWPKFARNILCGSIISALEGTFSGFLPRFFVPELPQKEVLLYTRIYSLLVNWCHHSVELCPFEQIDLSAWSLLT